MKNKKQNNKTTLFFITLFFFALTVSCTPYRKQVPITRQDLAPIKLAYVDFKIKKGASYDNWGDLIGKYEFRYASGCKRVKKEIHLNKDRVMKRDMRFFESFFRELNERYKVVLSKTNPYYIYSDRIDEPEYLMTAEIKDLFLNVCDHYDWKTKEYKNLRSGSSEIKASFKIVDLAKREVFWQGETTGYADIKYPTENGEKELVEKAFAQALRKASFSPGFFQTLARRRTKEELFNDKQELVKIALSHERQKQKAVEKIKDINGGIIPGSAEWWGDGHNGWTGVDGWLGQITIDKVKQFKKLTPTKMYQVRTGVVAVENKDGGIGSGLLLSPQLVLTANSVVDDYSNLKLKTINNRIAVGKPIRKHIKRDVALIYRKPTEFKPLPLRFDLPEVGEEVFFALGAPTEEFGEGFLEDKGIVTGYRYTDGGVDIMTSTFVQENALGGALIDKHGNVVGMAHSGIRILPEEKDYFIPIIDALQKLDVKVRGVEFKKKDIKKEWVPANQPSMEKPLPSKAKNIKKKYKKAKEKLIPDYELLPNYTDKELNF